MSFDLIESDNSYFDADDNDMYNYIIDDYNFDEENEYRDEYNVYDRVDYINYPQESNIIDKKYTSTNHSIDLLKFQTYLYKASTNIENNTNINTSYIVNEVNKYISLISFIKFKNPSALLFGYWALNDDMTINKSKIKKIIKEDLSKLLYPIYDYDIIRYCAMWKDILNNK